VALGVPGRLRPRIFSTFSTTRVVGRQTNTPATCTPGEIPGTHFQRLSRPQGTWFCRKKPRKKFQVTRPGINPGTVRLVAQRLNHYATSGPSGESSPLKIFPLVPQVSVIGQHSTSQTLAFPTDAIFSVKMVSFPKMP
jgi:hypothetical protein